MKAHRIHLIRTGTTAQGGGKRYVGQSDLPLSQQGMDELEELRERYRYPEVEAVFTSPLSRCVQTAGILYPHQEPRPVEELIDMSLGAFEGKTFEQLRGNADFSAWLADSFENAPPGGEDTGAFTGRLIVGLGRVYKAMMDQGISNAAVITHGGVIMTLLAAVGLPQQPLHQWAVRGGTGYTLLMSAQLWMQSGVAEVFDYLPHQHLEDDM